MNTFKSIPAVLALLLLLAMCVACGDDKEEQIVPPENNIPGKEVGIRQLSLKLPRLGRLEILFSRVNCHIHLKGKDDAVTYPVNTFLSATSDSLLIEAEDPILSELPHQLYHLNYVTFSRKELTSKAEDDGSTIPQDTIYIGARLSIEDPNNITFRSSFNVETDCIGAGNPNDPIAIACGQDFKKQIADALTADNDLSDKCFELTENINLQTVDVTNGKGWEPAGHNNINGGSTPFNGTIDGNGNRFENIYCHTSDGYGGLFYNLGSSAYIHDIQFHYVSLNGKDYLGTVACFAEKGSRLENLSLEGYITGKNYIGGLVGKGSPDVIRCISSIQISTTENGSYLGGMVGYGTGITFTDCIRNGQISAPQCHYVGGFAGYDSGGSLIRCYVSGNISGADMVGGFCGFGAHYTATDCLAGATVSYQSYAYPWQIFLDQPSISAISLEINGNDEVGGFIGNGFLSLTGKNAFKYKDTSTPSISGHNKVGGLIGHGSAKMASGTTFTSFAYIVASGEYAGGVLGFDETGQLSVKDSCKNEGIIHGNDYVGGICGGYVGSISGGTFVNTAEIHGHNYVGGLIGEIGMSHLGSIGSAFINDGNVIATGGRVGGFIGNSLNIRLQFTGSTRLSRESGSLKIEGSDRVGGIVGSLKIGVSCSNYILKDISAYANIIGQSNVGGLFGSVDIDQVNANMDLFTLTSSVRAVITSRSGNDIGGAIGFLRVNSSVNDSYTVTIPGIKTLNGSITANGNGVGGLVGRAENGKCRSLYFKNCDNYVNLTSQSSSNVNGYGGIIGLRDENGYEIKISQCSNMGDIYGPALSAAGGIVGQQTENVYIDQCYNGGKIDGSSAVGGILGRVYDHTTVTNCFNMGDVPWAPNKTLLAGIVGQKENKSKADLLIENCYNVGSTGWGIIGGEDRKN